MVNNDALLQDLMADVSEKMVESLKESIRQAVEKEISTNLSKALLQSEFYRRISSDLQSGLKEIYSEISQAKRSNSMAPTAMVAGHGTAEELFSEASDQLDSILKTTEKATENIMDIVEQLQSMQMAVANIVKGFESGGVKKEDRRQLGEINEKLGNDLMSIMTTLSFQDLTGQRIKIIINTIKKVEQIVLNLYMSTGLKLKAREEEPEKDLDQLDHDAQVKMSELKGPQDKTDQSAVDDLLGQLGL